LNGTGATAGSVKVSYDYSTQGFKFTDATNTITLKSGTSKNEVMGLTTTAITLDESGGYSAKVIPNGAVMRAASEQRYGMKVTFDSVNRVFKFQSGKTGDNSSLDVTNVNGAGLALFGLSTASVAKTELATRGIESTPAVAVGAAPTINLSNNFAVDATNNTFVVTVDGIKGTVKLPVDSNYSLSTFMAKLEKGINAMGANSATGGVPPTVNGVKVTFDQINNRFVFTTGTTGADSFIKISGSSNWGLETVEAGRGTTTSWIKPTQHQDFVGGAVQPKYIDGAGNETTNGDGFTTLPAWSPIYLDKGELTFDTGGNLVSPVEGTQLETVYLAGGKGALTINIDYSASTQFSSAFAVLSQSQDGAPEGDLVGVTIANDGLVSASFSNGTQKSLAKILLVNFSSPAGLRQIGDSSFLASAASGDPIIGTAGSAGFGTLRAGATERANVDLTQELVDLITAQRNFQANAKAIETSSTMTSAIINLRS
jgi:flagellar hook-basal body protein